MTTLVTGASGFIGRHFVRAMKQRGRPLIAAVRIFDRQLGVPQVQVPKCAISAAEWAPLMKNCDTVVYLLARAHVLGDQSRESIDVYRKINTKIAYACAVAAATHGVRRFVFVSTIGVHGESSGAEPIRATSSLCPISPYAISKVEAEAAVREAAIGSALQWTIVRPPLVHGPDAPGNMGRLLRALDRRLPLPLGFVTENRRSLVGIDNLVDLLLVCLDHPSAANETFLVSDGEDLSTAALLSQLGLAMHRPARLLPVPVPLLRVVATLMGRAQLASKLLDDLRVDIAHTRRTLGWSPPLDLARAIARTAGGLGS